MTALFNSDDRYHAQAAEFLNLAGEWHLLSTSIVVGQAASYHAKRQLSLFKFLHWLRGAVEIDDALIEDMPRVIEVMRKYADLPADLADASIVALCERRRIDIVASIDSDFDVYRLNRRGKFKNVFPAARRG